MIEIDVKCLNCHYHGCDGNCMDVFVNGRQIEITVVVRR